MSNICQRCKLNPTNGRKHCENCLEFFRNYYKQIRKRDAVTLGVCITCSKPKGKAKGLRCFNCAFVANERAKEFNARKGERKL